MEKKYYLKIIIMTQHLIDNNEEKKKHFIQKTRNFVGRVHLNSSGFFPWPYIREALSDGEHFHLEDQRRVRRNTTR